MTPHPFRWLPVAAIAVAITGCGDDPQTLLRKMAAAYRGAEHYADEARVIVRETRGGQSTESTQPFRVAFSRPDRVRIDAYDARVVADGSRLFAASGGVPGQVLVGGITSPLDMEQLFADEVLQGTLTQGEAGCPPQVPLLLADDTLDVILTDATEPPRLVGVESVDGHACQRVAVTKPDGMLELWIDRTRLLLRRMRVPTAAYADEASRAAGAPVGISVDVEFTNAAFTKPPAEAFVFEVPPTAVEVTKLEPLVRPEPPHPRLGSKAGLPPLATADGATADAAALGRGPLVLDFFFAGCGPASRTLPAVATGIAEFVAAETAAHGGERPALKHLAISLDPDDVPTAEVRRTLAEFGGVGTLVRDPQGVTAQTLGLETFPATVIVSSDGDVADVIVGDGPHIAADMTETLTALARGRSPANLVRGRHRRRIDDFRRTLARAAGGGAARLPEPVIAPRKQPVRFKLVPAWRASVAMPGNLVCLDAASGAAEPRIVVLDGWRTVVEFDGMGAERGRHELDLPADAGLAFLRTAVAADGRRWWLGGRRGGRQVFVFDDAWRLHASFPPAGDADAVADATLADLGGDGEPEVLVAFSGTAGLDAATLGGERIWGDREIGPLGAITVGPPAAGMARTVIGCTASGQLKRARSRSDTPAADPLPAFAALAAGPVAPDGEWAIVGVSSGWREQSLAAGIDPASLELAWRLPLAAGGHRDGPLEPVAWADLLGTPRRQWLIAGPDGCVTVAWADGRVVDRYFHGRPLLGLGGYRHADRGHVVIATRQGIEAFVVDDVALD